jgi:hypothetical protein
MRTTIDMPDPILRKAKMIASQKKTTLRMVILEALEQSFTKEKNVFILEDASVGSVPTDRAQFVTTSTINQMIDELRDTSRLP